MVQGFFFGDMAEAFTSLESILFPEQKIVNISLNSSHCAKSKILFFALAEIKKAGSIQQSSKTSKYLIGSLVPYESNCSLVKFHGLDLVCHWKLLQV